MSFCYEVYYTNSLQHIGLFPLLVVVVVVVVTQGVAVGSFFGDGLGGPERRIQSDIRMYTINGS